MLTYPFTTAVAGISQYQAVAADVAVGDSVQIVHEPTNPFDANAYMIVHRSLCLGYVPRAVAQRLVRNGAGAYSGVVVAVKAARATIGVDVQVLHPVDVAAGGNGAQIDERPAGDPASVCDVPQRGGTAQHHPTLRVVAAKRSGRILGTLVRADRTTRSVVVDSGTGEVPYPDGLVDIIEVR